MTVRQNKLIGMVGGMSSESSAIYYRLLNQAAHRRLGGHHNARSVLFTLDFDELNEMAALGRWDDLAETVAEAARNLERAGADLVMLTSVTAHRVADQVETQLSVPLLHVADATAQAIQLRGFARVGLFGTRYTMEQDFFSGRLRQRHGLEVLTPPQQQREALHSIIIDELTLGIVKQDSRAALMDMALDLQARGAQAVILGCTELPLLAALDDYPLPAFDVTQLHAEAALDIVLADGRA
ncbi:MAG: amino acid racemase [Mesorhizobium sp.]|uniref:aspartate/glutamate racemase family protein n=1 Tax=Mesorhizobium sp. TaxID=1871066 RepID=UPI000FE922F4|nr:amino acid racemase [Mesorhizobium sp.]RWN35185.1 MAG: amino acid racemase [Mesorhizobium sp.]